ncbi:MAG: hypothetical protein H6744_13245 [Deltaproteobacteria bacterium]|nr:hypothetical protein [Deltaproteobacteria bacterium]
MMKLLLALYLLLRATAVGAAPVEACALPDGRVPITQPFQTRAAERLLAPTRAGDALASPPGWHLDAVTLEPSAVRVELSGPGDSVSLRLVAAACDELPDSGLAPTASFAFAVDRPPATGAGRAALGVVADRVRAADGGSFWKAFVAPPNPAAPAAGEPPRASLWVRAFQLPLQHSTTGIALVLLALCLCLLVDARAFAADLGLRGPGGVRTVVAILALTAAGLALRALAGPTFLREAHPLLAIPPFADAPVLGQPIEVYPQGPQLIFAALRGLFPGDAYAAWLWVDVVLGALTIPAAYAMGAALTGRRATGLAAAALMAFWPQHIRVSASESVHVHVALFATLGLALAIAAARTGRTRTFAALTACAAATALMRPEASLWLAFLALVALSAGPGVRRRLLSPARVGIVMAAAWLTLPTVLGLSTSEHAQRFAPTSGATESIGGLGPFEFLLLLVRPDGRNAFFDLATTPAWLWPLALWGAVALFREGRRALALSLALVPLATLALYAHMGPAGVVFTMARYHLLGLPAVVLLTTFGALDALARLPRLTTPARRAAATAALAAAGAALWWPAMNPFPMDWQAEHAWALDLGRQSPPLIGDAARLVTPDNRRSLLDMAPRDMALPLTAARKNAGDVVTVEHALAQLHDGSDGPEAFFYQGLYCWFDIAPHSAETFSPQCDAMHRAFELEPVAALDLDLPTYLQAYVATRPPGPLPLRLYRIGRRLLAPADAVALLPRPIAPGSPEADMPMGSGARAQMEPPTIPLTPSRSRP